MRAEAGWGAPSPDRAHVAGARAGQSTLSTRRPSRYAACTAPLLLHLSSSSSLVLGKPSHPVPHNPIELFALEAIDNFASSSLRDDQSRGLQNLQMPRR